MRKVLCFFGLHKNKCVNEGRSMEPLNGGTSRMVRLYTCQCCNHRSYTVTR